MTIGEKIKLKRSQEGLSAAKVAKLLGTNKENVYKWENGSTPSDPEVYNKIVKWLETVPQGTPVFGIVSEGSLDAEYIHKYIKSLEDQLTFYKERVQLSLTDISNKVTIARAEIRAATEYQVMKDAKNNDQKRKELMGVIDTLIGENLQVDGQRGIVHARK